MGIILASVTTLRQLDFKQIVAYSSIAHMNIVVLGLFSFNLYGIIGGILLMFSHGLTAASLFFIIGIFYDRFHTRLLFYIKGLAVTMPLFASLLSFFLFANTGFPGTSSFIGEFLSLLGLIHSNFFLVACCLYGLFMSTAYSI